MSETQSKSHFSGTNTFKMITILKKFSSHIIKATSHDNMIIINNLMRA